MDDLYKSIIGVLKEDYTRLNEEKEMHNLLVENGLTKGEATQLINEEPVTAGTVAIGVILGKLGYDLLGLLVGVLAMGVGFSLVKAKEAWDQYQKIRKDKALKNEIEDFAKNSAAFRDAKKAFDKWYEANKKTTQKMKLKGLRGDERKQRANELQDEITELKKAWESARSKLRIEIEKSDISDKAKSVLKINNLYK